jgi:hypothetical protein
MYPIPNPNASSNLFWSVLSLPPETAVNVRSDTFRAKTSKVALNARAPSTNLPDILVTDLDSSPPDLTKPLRSMRDAAYGWSAVPVFSVSLGATRQARTRLRLSRRRPDRRVLSVFALASGPRLLGLRFDQIWLRSADLPLITPEAASPARTFELERAPPIWMRRGSGIR